MGLLDMLMGAPTVTQQPTNFDIPSFLTSNTQSQQQQPGVVDAPPPSQDVSVTATRPRPNAVPAGGYNNTPELQAISGVENSYPQGQQGPGQGTHLGLTNMIPDAMPGAGTLRNLLGTLGDAFLISSGHQPIHQQQLDRRQIANAAAGFDTDPSGAASRIAATGAPGSMADAQSMYNEAETAKLRQAQQQSNDDYRQSNIDLRKQSIDSQTAQRQAMMEDRTRQAMGGVLQAAAATGDQTKYDAARQRAIALGKSRIKDFDPDTEVPANIAEYGGGYGMSAGQVARQATSNASIDERATAADQRDTTTRRGQDMSYGANKARVGATYAGQANSQAGQVAALVKKQNAGVPLTPAEQAVFTHGTHVGSGAAGGGLHLPPGLMPAGAASQAAPIGSNLAAPHPNGTITSTPSQHQTGPVHVYPSGRKAQWNGHAWVPIN